ncbi:MAG: PQQ-binding-like beta-propeller repeat protein [Planctomycetes bacterium]|nr:PQQ-binding-like beta-propeller repeat protein [Planctomycetota bacterium]
MAPDPSSSQPVSYYEAQLAELPLRIKSYDLTGNMRRTPIVVRELHVVHDDVRDEILVVDSDGGQNHLWSLDAYDFTLHWKTVIDKRVDFDPLPTRKFIHLMNSDGEYQGYDRLSSPREGESRLVAKGRFQGDVFPSAPPASNDTHLFVPATNSNSILGRSMITNARGEGAETWVFPQVGEGVVEQFMQITMSPAADRETVAFVNNNRRLYMVDAQSGEFRANPYLDAHSRTPPLIKDDLVFVGSDIGQVFAWQKSGEAAWALTVDGLPYGRIFVEDRWVFVHTLEVYDEEVVSDDGKTKVKRTTTRPGMFSAFRYEIIDVENDRPVYSLVDGDPSTSWKIDPIWSEPDVGQEVMMLHNDRAFVLYEENEEFLNEREKAKLRDEGRLVRKSDELRTVRRQLRVLDLDTGFLARPEWNLNLMDFAYVRGSMQERDRAIYLATKDGYVFKVYGDNKRSAGGG